MTVSVLHKKIKYADFKTLYLDSYVKLIEFRSNNGYIFLFFNTNQ